MTRDPKSIALTYIDACARKDLDLVASLLAPDVEFTGPNGPIRGPAAYLATLRRIGPIWATSEVRKAFTDGDDVCVVYDFVTDTAAGKVPAMEWLRIEGGRIRRIDLIFDRVTFKPASDELARRAA
jgi:hypothetical protein